MHTRTPPRMRAELHELQRAVPLGKSLILEMEQHRSYELSHRIACTPGDSALQLLIYMSTSFIRIAKKMRSLPKVNTHGLHAD